MIIVALMLNPTNKSKRFTLDGRWASIILSLYLVFFGTVFYLNFEESIDELILGLVIIAVVANYFIFHKNLLYLALYSGVIASCTTTSTARLASDRVLYQDRNFYGVLSIKKTLAENVGEGIVRHEIYSGSTEHGAQVRSENLLCTPVSYYGRQGPIGQLFSRYDGLNADWRVGIVGLGSGALGGYAKKGNIGDSTN
nr:hypothetical protein [Methylomarinum sp. Ch1-1]MDP4520822.1 hypothetical protein [Methylomarinum sp. Ch1-1]